MTARQLYDLSCDTAYDVSRYDRDRPPLAWPFLAWRERCYWRDLASKVDKKPRRKK